jgi:serine/threonine protein kinase
VSGGEGSTFGKYYLLKRIATGGMGEIFLAKLRGPVGFEKLLVIKRILAQHVGDPEFVDMFFAEARVAAQLSHSNIVQIYEMGGPIDEAYFIAMEYVHGKSLRGLLDRVRARGRRLHPAHAIEIVSGLCTGMGYAHAAADMSGQQLGIVHRDLNPHNLLVSYSGEVKIIDFGIAKSEMTTHKTETGTIKGKFVYMSPEQSAAEPLDKRSDIFSIGICLYEALTDVNPFARSNTILSLDAIQREDPPPLGEVSADLAPLEPVVRRALAKSQDERYADCSELLRDLQRLLRSGAVPPAPKSLAATMNELFEDTIRSEQRMIVDTDQARASELASMREYQSKEHHTPSDRWRVPLAGAATELRGKPEPSAMALESSGSGADEVEPPRSRLPFFLVLAAIVVGTAAGVLAMKRAKARRTPATITEITPTALAASAASASAAEGSRRRVEAASSAAEHGALRVSVVPPVAVTLGGAAIGPAVKLRGATGTLVVGSGADAQSDPFKVTIHYAVTSGAISYGVDAEPWAVVRGKGGVGMGKTPLPPAPGEATTVFELVNPKESRQLRITLHYEP